MKSISVVGLGKLGSPFLATCASRGFNVIGVDISNHLVRLLNKSKAPVDEPGLKKLISENRRKIKATSDYSEAVNNSDITFIIVPTPSDQKGAFSNKYVIDACLKIGRILKNKDTYHIVVVVSTVMPNSITDEIIPVLEKASGKSAGRDFGVCYNPEFIALGSVVNNLLNPDFVLIGESDKKSGEILEGFYLRFCINKPPVVRMNFVNAEISKIALNSYITTKISFANTLAQICGEVSGGNVDLVTSAIGQDSRVGSKYLKGALAYGGPCFPRDNRAFSYFAEKVGVKASIAKAADLVNWEVTDRIVKQVKKIAHKKKLKIGILGLAYKPDTDVSEESVGVKIAHLLSKNGLRIYVWDPKVFPNNTNITSKKVVFAKSMKDCVTKVDVIIITTPWKEFKKINPNDLKRSSASPILIDCWRMLDPLKYKNVARYWAVGLGNFELKR